MVNSSFGHKRHKMHKGVELHSQATVFRKQPADTQLSRRPSFSLLKFPITGIADTGCDLAASPLESKNHRSQWHQPVFAT